MTDIGCFQHAVSSSSAAVAAAPDHFTLQVFNTISDPYNDVSQRSDREKGLAFIARASRTGKVCMCCGASYLSSPCYCSSTAQQYSQDSGKCRLMMHALIKQRYCLKGRNTWTLPGAAPTTPNCLTWSCCCTHLPINLSVHRRKLLANAEKKKLMVNDGVFKASSPMKLSTGEGDFQGTFGGKVPYIAVCLFHRHYLHPVYRRSPTG